MKITLDIPDCVFLAFLNGVEYTKTETKIFSYQLDRDDFVDGNIVKLPREKTEV